MSLSTRPQYILQHSKQRGPVWLTRTVATKQQELVATRCSCTRHTALQFAVIALGMQSTRTGQILCIQTHLSQILKVYFGLTGTEARAAHRTTLFYPTVSRRGLKREENLMNLRRARHTFCAGN